MQTPRDPPQSGEAGVLDEAVIAHSVLYQLRRVHGLLSGRFIARFSALDLRPAEYGTLLLISGNPGRRQSEIASVIGIQRANFVVLVSELERRGLIERRDAPNDRRSHALYLTQAGESLLAEGRQVEAALERDYVEKLGGMPARDEFLTLLKRLAD